MAKNIPISEKHGVNPSLDMCIFCDQPKGIALLGRLPNDAEAPRKIITNYEPCDKCQAEMDKGITFIGTTPTPPSDSAPAIGKDENGNPLWPTGSWTVLTEEGVKRLITWPQSEEIILAKRCLCPQEVIDQFDSLVEKETKGNCS